MADDPEAAALRLVTRLDVADVLQRQAGAGAVAVASVAGSDGLEQEADVVAERQLADHLADEPVLARIEDRGALRSAVPLARLELVDAVTGLTAEQLGEASVWRRRPQLAAGARASVVRDASEVARLDRRLAEGVTERSRRRLTAKRIQPQRVFFILR